MRLSATLERAGQSLAAAILAHEPNALRANATPACAAPDHAPTRTWPLRTRSSPKIARSSRVRPEPEQSGDPEDFAAMQRERRAARLERLDLDERDVAGRRARFSDSSSSTSRPTIMTRHGMRVGLGRRAAADVSAVAKNDESVGRSLHLLEEVRDVDDGVTPGHLESADEVEEPLDVLVRRGCSSARRGRARDNRAPCARAISTSCCTAGDRSPTMASGAIAPCPSAASAVCGASAARRRGAPCPHVVGSMPSAMFSITDRCGASDSPW